MARFRMIAALSAGACLGLATLPASAAVVTLTGAVTGGVSSVLQDRGPLVATLGDGTDWSVALSEGPGFYTATIDLTETFLSIDLSRSLVFLVTDKGYRFTFTGLGISAATLDLNTTDANVSLSIIDGNTFAVSIDDMTLFAPEQVRFSLTPATTPVPEPTTLALVAAALIAGGAVRRQRVAQA